MGFQNGHLTSSSTSVSASTGLKNYLGSFNFENGQTTGWGIGTTGALTNGIPTATPTFSTNTVGTGGAGGATTLSISTTSSALSGRYSLQYASSASTTVGDCVASSAMAIDASDQAKVLQFKFNYKLASGTGVFAGNSTNSLGVAVWDVTNSAWINPAGCFNLVQTSGVGTATGTFQTGVNTASIRFVIYNISATTGAITMVFDDFFVGPQVTAIAPALSDWTAYTMSITDGTGANVKSASPSIDNAYWRRVGDSIQIQFRYTHGATVGSNGSGTYRFCLPSGLTIDTSKANPGGINFNGSIPGNGITSTVTATGITAALEFVVTGSVGYVNAIMFPDASGTNGAILAGSNLNFSKANVEVGGFFQVPISGWSSNAVSSADTDTRVVSFRAGTSGVPAGTVASAFASCTAIQFNSVKHDSHGAYNPSTGIYTVPVAGYYRITAQQGVGGTYATNSSASLAIMQGANFTNVGCQVSVSGQTTLYPIVSTTVQCVAGDQITVRAQTAATSPALLSDSTANFLVVERLSGPAVVQATETVACKYTATTGTINTTQSSNFAFANKKFDTHSAFNGTTFTAPVSGKYRLTSQFYIPAVNNSTAQGLELDAYVTSTPEGISGLVPLALVSGVGVSRGYTMSGTLVFQLLAGDTIGVRPYSDTSASISATDNRSLILIERIGN